MKTDEDKIADLLRNLPRISAPSDFDAVVIEKINARRGKGSLPDLRLLLRFGLPAAALVAIAVILFLPPAPDNALIPAVEELANTRVTEKLPADETIRPETGTDRASASARQNLAGGVASDRNISMRGQSRTPSPKPADEGGSIDSAISPAAPPIMPPGLETRLRNTKGAVMPDTGRPVRIEEILQMLGVSAVCGTDGCDVRSVAAGSVAGGAGLLPGDRITAVNSQPVGEAFSAAAVTVRTVTVLRGGEMIVLQMRLP